MRKSCQCCCWMLHPYSLRLSDPHRPPGVEEDGPPLAGEGFAISKATATRRMGERTIGAQTNERCATLDLLLGPLSRSGR